MAHICCTCLLSSPLHLVWHVGHVHGHCSCSLVTTNQESNLRGFGEWHVLIPGMAPSFSSGIFAFYLSGNCLGAPKVCMQCLLKVPATLWTILYKNLPGGLYCNVIRGCGGGVAVAPYWGPRSALVLQGSIFFSSPERVVVVALCHIGAQGAWIVNEEI